MTIDHILTKTATCGLLLVTFITSLIVAIALSAVAIFDSDSYLD